MKISLNILFFIAFLLLGFSNCENFQIIRLYPRITDDSSNIKHKLQSTMATIEDFTEQKDNFNEVNKKYQNALAAKGGKYGVVNLDKDDILEAFNGGDGGLETEKVEVGQAEVLEVYVKAKGHNELLEIVKEKLTEDNSAFIAAPLNTTPSLINKEGKSILTIELAQTYEELNSAQQPQSRIGLRHII